MLHSNIPNMTSVISSILLRILLLVASSLAFIPERIFAFDISAGAGALEEGDDRARPAAIVHMSFPNNYLARGYLWGRSFGPVTETDGILSVGKRYDIFGSKYFGSVVGASGMVEKSSIKYDEYPQENSTYTSTNMGVMLGLHYDLIASKRLKLAASWEAHIFPAGSAIIVLVTARKQILGLTAGVTF